eukprot:75303_1
MGNSSSRSGSMNTDAYFNLNDWKAEYVFLQKNKLQRKLKRSSNKPIAVIIQNNATNGIVSDELKSELKKEMNILALETHNYRNKNFIFNHISGESNRIHYRDSNSNSEYATTYHNVRPIIQDLIDPFLNLNIDNNTSLKNNDDTQNKKRLQWIPVLFEYNKHKNKYIICSEINSIPYHKHKALYNIIQEIFNKTIPMFQYILRIKNLSKKYKRLYVIVKCQKYTFKEEMEYVGGWHCEGSIFDRYIVANSLYYFDKQEFITDKLHICAKIALRTGRCGSKWMEDDIIDIDVKNDMFITFSNTETIHRVELKVDGEQNRQLLAFFLIDPKRENEIDVNDIKTVNWIYKAYFIVINWFRNIFDDNLTFPEDMLVMMNEYICGDSDELKQLSDHFRTQNSQYVPYPSRGNRWNIMSGAD